METWLSLKANNFGVCHFLLNLPHWSEAAKDPLQALVTLDQDPGAPVVLLVEKPISCLLGIGKQLPLFLALVVALSSSFTVSIRVSQSLKLAQIKTTVLIYNRDRN